jgi:hypothetical protein
MVEQRRIPMAEADPYLLSGGLTRLKAADFVEAVLARIPPSPPNHSRIIELNERGELPDHPSELEAGANRCAVA